MISIMFFYLFLINFAWCESCLDVNFSMFQTITNNGFHREFKWTTGSSLSDDQMNDLSKCLSSLVVHIPSGIYVNPDEIAELNRKNIINAFVDGDINLELPEHEAKEQNVHMFLNTDEIRNITITLPFHLRYHRATFGGGNAEVSIEKPSLLLNCPKAVVFCEKFTKIKTYCDKHGAAQCFWNNVTYKPYFEDAKVLVPVGNLDNFPLVAISSLILGCLGCIYILTVIVKKKTD